MTWEILFHDEFLPEFSELTTEVPRRTSCTHKITRIRRSTPT